ncbi:FAD-binding domain-containing protein [Basidiobolus meristosporus CBS 931.73]|uniref:FAD-binding domain-containing protein n=1 Tax=Basidiobolus meristosporus CBS 931.73 TaxID=1314790 RepID=A0A1Y1Y9T7_9FUNG|nr:FAD-binding domain-containing protein [Basidiobolus meristosporus CBS 931.73]|eukprot:ORX94762.1 FAD-binding domain-containing protein [Basidiobolus meristosporus CBS 931.73]
MVLLQHADVAVFPRIVVGQVKKYGGILNSSINGQLLQTRPPAYPCHEPNHNQAECNIVRDNYIYGTWRSNQAGAMQAPNWEITSDSCSQGSVSVYTVDARNAADVQEAVQFSHQHNLRLVVKNTGHDFLGRSAGYGSLNIWTHHLDRISFHYSFIPEGFDSGASSPAVSLGPGIQWKSVYETAEAHGVNVIGGASPSVGAAGGYCQGGGHSPLSVQYGLCVDNALQYKVVTADGELLTANECGGGTFSIAFDNIVAMLYRLNTTDEANYLEAIKEFIRLQPSWEENVGISGGHFRTYTSFLDWHETFVSDTTGTPVLLSSRLIPLEIFKTDKTVDQLAKTLIEAQKTNGKFDSNVTILGHLVAGGAFTRNKGEDTSVHPAWREALRHMVLPTSWDVNTSLSEQRKLASELTERTQPLRDITPGSGAYFNEPHWQQAFFVRNYRSLRRIEAKYDPDGLFVCHHCVGSEEWSDDLNCRV